MRKSIPIRHSVFQFKNNRVKDKIYGVCHIYRIIIRKLKNDNRSRLSIDVQQLIDNNLLFPAINR